MADLIDSVGGVFGFSKWNLGIGQIGNFFVWLFISMIVVAILGFFIYAFMVKKTYKHQIRIIGMVGNTAMEKWLGRGKEVKLGRAGDKLFFLRKMKRFVPPPTIQEGFTKWGGQKYLYWEREDGELINIGYENVDEKQRRMGIKFVDIDMRMQRLGIEKNLQFRLQKENFWQKYGQTVINAIFYVLVTILMVVMFTQFVKVSEALKGAVAAAEGCKKSSGEVSPYVPSLVFVGLTKFKIWKLKRK